MMEAIPVISFSSYRLGLDEPDSNSFQKLVDEVYDALTSVGFMCLKDFGVPNQTIQDAFNAANEFFLMGGEEKLKYLSRSVAGYHAIESEWIDHDIPFCDLKETFVFYPFDKDQTYPDEDFPEFRKSLQGLFDIIIPIYKRVLRVIGHCLRLQDVDYFVDRHRTLGTDENLANLKINFYPALGDREVKEGQIRFGEHTDFGSITLLFQDMAGGLEVQTVDGKWIPATPLEGSIVVNIGDLMQRWTCDKLIAGRHRVVVPTDQKKRDTSRLSIAFFGNPDNDVIVECIDKSDKYPPITCKDYLQTRMNDVYMMDPQ